MRRNYAKARQTMAVAISRELLREDGHWPAVKAKVRGLASDELYQFADVAAAAILDSELIRVTVVRRTK